MYSWDPLIKKQCFSVYGAQAQGPDCAPNGYRWLWGTTNEDSNFNGGALNSFGIDHPVFKYSFHSRASDASYEVGIVTDKVNFDYFRDRYTFVGFTDNWDVNAVPKPPLSENLHSTFAMKMPAVEQVDDGVHGLAKNRVVIGTVATWNGRAHYLEVNLYKTSNFDLCTGSCDPQNIYDRKFSYAGGEGVYFDGAQLGLVTGGAPQVLRVGQTYQSFDIPWAQLFRAAPWTDTPTSWTGITLGGVYLGHEVWGKGRVWVELNDYQTFADLTRPIPPPLTPPSTLCAGFSVPACPAGTYPTPGAVDAKGCIGPSVCTAETRVSGPFLFAVPAQNAYAQGSAYAGEKATAGQRAAVVYAPTSGAATVTYENLALPSRAVTRLVGTVGLSPVKPARVGQRPTYRGSVTVTVTASGDKIDSSDAASEVLYTTTLSSITGPQQLSVPLGVWGMRPHTKLTVSVQKTKADAAVYGAVIDGLGYTTFGDRPDQGIVNNDPEWKPVDQQNKQLASLATFPVTWIHDSMRTTGAGWGQAPLLKRVQDQGKKIQIVIGQVDEDYTEGTAARVPGTNQWGGALPLSKLHLDLYEKRLKNNLTSYKNAGVDIKAFEVGNELDLVGFNGDIPTNRAPTDADYKLFAETYARILERTVSVVKRPEFYPNAKIILGSPAIDWSPATGKLDPIKMYAPLQNLNGKNYFALVDGVGLHFYPAQSEDGSQSMARGEAYLDTLGLSNRPVWVSEWGYANNTFPNSSGADRYRAFTTLYDRMLRADFKVVFMTNFALDEFSYPFHLVDTNYQKLPEARFFDHYQSPTPSTVVLERVAVPPVACTWCAVTAWAEELVARVRDTVLTKISNYPYGPKYE